MIKLSDIRVGNLLYNTTTKEEFVVYPEFIAQLALLTESTAINCDGVVLTSERLIRNGWHITHKETLQLYYYPDFAYFRVNFYANGEYCLAMDCSPLIHILSEDMKYAHQLQNAFYTLGHKELTLK